MTRHALLASELERRRIAEDLHHGVVQELAGLGYTLPTVARQLEPGGDVGTARQLLDRAAGLVHSNLLALRSLMTDIYPPDLRGAGLGRAVHQLVDAEARGAGLRSAVHVEEDLDVEADVGSLAYRTVREGVRNVVKHAQATRVVVELRTRGADLVVRVADDGRGTGGASSPPGHFGLRLLADTVRDVGGSVSLQPGEEGGTTLVATIPLHPSTP